MKLDLNLQNEIETLLEEIKSPISPEEKRLQGIIERVLQCENVTPLTTDDVSILAALHASIMGANLIALGAIINPKYLEWIFLLLNLAAWIGYLHGTSDDSFWEEE